MSKKPPNTGYNRIRQLLVDRPNDRALRVSRKDLEDVLLEMFGMASTIDKLRKRSDEQQQEEEK